MELVDGYTIAWVVWIAAFLGIEGAALVRKEKGDTLSEHVWKWFAVKGGGKYKTVRRLALGAFMGWLCTHFFTGGMI